VKRAALAGRVPRMRKSGHFEEQGDFPLAATGKPDANALFAPRGQLAGARFRQNS
jgi:hypothetical protein